MALPNTVAEFPAPTTTVASRHLTFVSVDGSTTVPSPLTPRVVLLAVKPKAILSDACALAIWPPPVTWPGVLDGRIQALVAVPHGSPASTALCPWLSAQPVIRSAPGSAGPR